VTAAVVRDGQGRKLASLRAPRWARVLAAMAFATTAVGVLLQIPRIWVDEGVRLVLSSFFCAVAGVGLATRLARLSVDGDGVHWGIGSVGFRFARGRIRAARVYRDGVTLVPQRGRFAWHLGARDWSRFERFPSGLLRAGVPISAEERKSPFSERIQSYGVVLDGLLCLCMLASAALYFL
jgi:hypothetical protein